LDRPFRCPRLAQIGRAEAAECVRSADVHSQLFKQRMQLALQDR
jgi:hypothetical protein